jgi:Tesmin/TSO1-like CXC domain, cysteine-rich domain
MTSLQELQNDTIADNDPATTNQCDPSNVFVSPSYAVSEEAQNPHFFNKENMEEEAATKRPNFPSVTILSPVHKNAAESCSAQQNDSASSSFPMPPPPMMSFSSSIAFSDITFPLYSLLSSKSFDRKGHQAPIPQMTELLRYTSASGHAFNGMSSSNFDTPMHDSSSFMAYSTVDHDLHRLKASCHDDSDLTMAANALLDLTPSVINKNMEGGPVPTVKSAQNASQRRLSISAELDDWGRRWVETPIPTTSQPTKYNNKLQIVLRAQELLEEDILFTLHACRCKNSHCLKLYCGCFQSGTFCDPLICVCRGCENSAAHSVPRGSRTRAIYEILHRRMNAFDPKPKKMGQGCSCKKNRFVSSCSALHGKFPTDSMLLFILFSSDACKSTVIAIPTTLLVLKNVGATTVSMVSREIRGNAV